MATNYGKVATSASQQAQNRANLASALKSLSKAGGTATAAQNIYSGGGGASPSTPVATNNTTSSGRSPIYGTGSAPAGSGSPVGMTKTPVLGTTGNPAGSQLPVGMSKANTKAATTASAVGTTKKPDWQLQMESINRASGPIDETGTGSYGMTKDPSYTPPKQTASAFDAFKSAQNNRVNTDLQTTGLQTSAGNGVPSSNLMTKADGSNFPNRPIVQPNIDFTPEGPKMAGQTDLGNTSPQPISSSQNKITPPPPTTNASTPPVVNQTTTASSSSAPSQTSTFGMDNTRNKAPDLTQVQAAAGIADETRKQADAADQAAQSATNEDDRNYYRKLADSARAEADAAEAEYQKLLQQSEEEKQIQSKIDAETNALRLGQTDVAGQPIPLQFITGQQSALERRSLDRVAPLTSKLGQLQAARQAALTGAKSKVSSKESRLGTAESNLTAISTEERKRKNQLQDQAREDKQTAQEQANIDRKFQEDKRQFGLNYANQQRELAIKEIAAKSSANKGLTDVQLKQEINKQLANPSFQKASEQEKINYILSQGGDPTDFGLNY